MSTVEEGLEVADAPKQTSAEMADGQLADEDVLTVVVRETGIEIVPQRSVDADAATATTEVTDEENQDRKLEENSDASKRLDSDGDGVVVQRAATATRESDEDKLTADQDKLEKAANPFQFPTTPGEEAVASGGNAQPDKVEVAGGEASVKTVRGGDKLKAAAALGLKRTGSLLGEKMRRQNLSTESLSSRIPRPTSELQQQRTPVNPSRPLGRSVSMFTRATTPSGAATPGAKAASASASAQKIPHLIHAQRRPAAVLRRSFSVQQNRRKVTEMAEGMTLVLAVPVAHGTQSVARSSGAAGQQFVISPYQEEHVLSATCRLSGITRHIKIIL